MCRMKTIIPGLILIVLFSLQFACDTVEEIPDGFIDELTDERDGNVYQTVTIGGRVWMAESLRYLPISSSPSFGSDEEPRYYVFGYWGTDTAHAKGDPFLYDRGVIYNWLAAIDACPQGWHLPTQQDWEDLIDHLGGRAIAGGKLKIPGTQIWREPNAGASNAAAFSALPNGEWTQDWPSGFTEDSDTRASFWSATESSNATRLSYAVRYHDTEVSSWTYRISQGLCVRCIRDD